MTRPSVLYVTYDGLLEPLGASQVVPYVLGLAERGHPIEILSFEKPADLGRPEAVARLRATLDARGVGWTARRYHQRPTLPATLWDVAVGRRDVARWARRRAGGIVHARGYVPGLIGLAARRRGGTLLFDMRGFWVDERIEAGHWRAGGPEARIGRWIERRLLAEAAHVVLNTERAAGRVGALAPRRPAPPVTVVPPCVDLARFRPPEDPAAARSALGLPDVPTVIHTGNLIGWYDGPGTVRAGRAFVERTGGSFVILTRQREEAARLVREGGVEARIETADPADVPRWLQAADAGLALVRATPAKDASFPTRLGEYLACGLAVLASDVGDVGALADGEVLGLVGSEGGPEPAGAWLAEAAARPDRSARARALAERHLSLEEGVRRLDAVYGALAGGRAGEGA